MYTKFLAVTILVVIFGTLQSQGAPADGVVGGVTGGDGVAGGLTGGKVDEKAGDDSKKGLVKEVVGEKGVVKGTAGNPGVVKNVVGEGGVVKGTTGDKGLVKGITSGPDDKVGGSVVKNVLGNDKGVVQGVGLGV